MPRRGPGPNVNVDFRIIGNFNMADPKVARIFNQTTQEMLKAVERDARHNTPVAAKRTWPQKQPRSKVKPGVMRKGLQVKLQPVSVDASGTPVSDRTTRAGNQVYTMTAGFNLEAAKFAGYVIYGTGTGHVSYKGLKQIPNPRTPWKIPGERRFTRAEDITDEMQEADAAAGVQRAVVETYPGTGIPIFGDVEDPRTGRMYPVPTEEFDKLSKLKVFHFKKPLAVHNPAKFQIGRWYYSSPPELQPNADLWHMENGKKVWRTYRHVLLQRGQGRLTIPGQKANPFLHVAVDKGRTEMRRKIMERVAGHVGETAKKLSYRMTVQVS